MLALYQRDIWPCQGGYVIQWNCFGTFFIVEGNQNFVVVEIDGIHKGINESFPMAFDLRVHLVEPGQSELRKSGLCLDLASFF